MSTLLEVCHCGHHKDTHHDRGAGDCLGVGCPSAGPDRCTHYRDALKPDTLRRPLVRPDHASWCRCFTCKRYWEEKYKP